MDKRKKTGLVILCLLLSVLVGGSCLAISSLVDTSDPAYATGNYKLESVREYAIYIMKIILGLVGSLSLLAFVYGGVMFLTSAGSSKQVEDGINAIKAAVIGLLLTFASVLIINLFFGGLGIKWDAGTGVISQDANSCSAKHGKDGYSCTTETANKDCKNNLCPGAAGIKCCK